MKTNGRKWIDYCDVELQWKLLLAILYPQGARCWVPTLRATSPLSASQRVLLLDSRLRGNDEANGQSRLNPDFPLALYCGCSIG